ncbi:CCA tRNA nucleotidyltransferase [Pelagibacterium luteolum]|uniref:Poly(A) polymerase n=1 Tax=Pelagibacterium luteolum TaxID=440168 RepID=A0A1G7USK0_9HYPH|nr:CCA tRNA nucleotidyltransferase [Pelagibacterium luteolum]SDG50484.1 poly(A) polymerase [Pelagibacterium luteolum]
MQSREALERLRSAGWLARARPFFDALDGASMRTRAVGGLVRDTLLARPVGSGDIDLATELTPDEVMFRAAKAGIIAHPTGIEHGTVTLVSDGVSAEVTTLRRDVETFGRHARVVFGADWAADAARRDFTMNALYADADGNLFDPLGGLEDCLAQRVRFIGDPNQRIAEDRLRVYRYFRFSATHGGQQLDPAAISACERAAGDLGALSAERVGAEMMRLLDAPKCARTLKQMARIGLLDPALFDEIGLDALALREVQSEPTATQRLGLLAALGRDIAPLRESWRLSNATMEVIDRTRRAADIAASGRWLELAQFGPDVAMDGIAVAQAVTVRDADWRLSAEKSTHARLGRKFPLSGAHLIAKGFTPGPAIGAELSRLERLWLESDGALTKADLLTRVVTPR